MTEFARIFTPRTEKAVKAISLLTNGVRYSPTEDETTHLMDVLKDAVNDIAQLYGVLPGSEAVSVQKDVSAESSEDRIDGRKLAIKRSAFDRTDVLANVMSIPETQLTTYATHIMARLCEKFETPEAQPKNYTPKEEA